MSLIVLSSMRSFLNLASHYRLNGLDPLKIKATCVEKHQFDFEHKKEQAITDIEFYNNNKVRMLKTETYLHLCGIK